jgi:hypothetical protein
MMSDNVAPKIIGVGGRPARLPDNIIKRVMPGFSIISLRDDIHAWISEI